MALPLWGRPLLSSHDKESLSPALSSTPLSISSSSSVSSSVISRNEALQLSGKEWEESSWYFLFDNSSCFPSSASLSFLPEADQEIFKCGNVVRWYSEGVLQRSFTMENPVIDVCWAQFFHHSPSQVNYLHLLFMRG